MNYKKISKKKFISVFLCAVAILIATSIAVPFFSKEEGYRMITVFEVSGTVGVVKDGIEYEAYPGMHLQEGHVIVTSEDSYARLVLDDDKYVKVEAGSRLEFETLGLLGTNKTRLKLDRGAITSEIVNPLGADEEYVVNTPNAVLAVRGTFFRVDLRVTKNGEIDTNVYTYGGKVASNRVMPTGEMVEEEVLVDAGYMTAIRMDAVDTIYIVGMTESPTGEPVEEVKKNTVPIEPATIPDADLVDMYFASENGHEMFLSTDEIEENIKEREISIEEQASIYDKANEVKAELEESNTEGTTSTALIPDDRGDWIEDTEVAVEENDEPQVEEVVENIEIQEDVVVEVEEEIVPEETAQETPEQVVVITPVTPPTSTEEAHVHSYSSAITTSATCTTDGVKTYSCTCGDSYTEAIAAIGHSEVTKYTEATANADGLRRVYCENCNETYQEEVLFSIPLHFPDSGFAEYVSTNFDEDGYNSLNATELAALEAATSISLQGTSSQDGGVTSLEGIEYFSSLTALDCGYNAGITKLDMSSCTGLTSLSVSGATGLQRLTLDGCTGLSSLDLSANSRLTSVVCKNTGLTALNLSDKIELSELVVFHCSKLKSINISGCTALGISGTNLMNLPAVTTVNASGATSLESLGSVAFPELMYLYLDNTAFTAIDLTSYPKLLTLNVDNTNIRQLDLQSNTKIDTLKITNVPLERLIIYANSLARLDLSSQANTLTYLDIKCGAGLSSLDLSANTELTYFAGDTVNVSELDLTQNSKLKTVMLYNCTYLENFNISGNSVVETITISTSALQSANFENCSALKSLDVSTNPLTNLSLTGCDSLESLSIAATSLNDLTVSNKAILKTLYMYGCKGFTSLDLNAYTQLSELTISNCTNLLTVDTGGRYSNGDLNVLYEDTDFALTIDGITVNNN